MELPRDGAYLPIMRRTTSTQMHDAAIDAIAATQHGLVSRDQLRAAGIPLHTIDNRVKFGRLRLVHRGVYRVGPLVVARAAEMGAVLACGPGAAVSHRSAGALWQLSPPPPRGTVEVIASPGTGRRVAGLRIYRCSCGSDDVTVREALPITTVARTLLDLGAVLTLAELERALAIAEREHLASRRELQQMLERHPRHRGAHRLRSFIDASRLLAFTRSKAEQRLVELVRNAQLPTPAMNVRLHGFEVDAFWKAQRLVVEVDGVAYHSSDRSFDEDRRRDAVLTAAGLRVVRVTWRQLTRERDATLARLAQALVSHPS
jgi:very-short-patch-repair endonuclease